MITLIIIFVVLVIVAIFLFKKYSPDPPIQIVIFFVGIFIMLISWISLSTIPSTYTETTTKYDADLTDNTLAEIHNEYYYIIKIIDKDSISKKVILPKDQTIIKFGSTNKLITHQFKRTKCTRNLFVIELFKPIDNIELIVKPSDNK